MVMGKAIKLKARKLKKKAQRLGARLLEKARSRDSEARAVVALCKGCGAANELASWLKDQVGSRKRLAGKLAIERVGCLGPCPKKKLTVALGGTNARDWGQGFVLDPDRDRKALLSLLVQRLAV
jgi:predicted metal-binding protein